MENSKQQYCPRKKTQARRAEQRLECGVKKDNVGSAEKHDLYAMINKKVLKSFSKKSQDKFSFKIFSLATVRLGMRGRLEQEEELETEPLSLAGGDEESAKRSHKRSK